MSIKTKSIIVMIALALSGCGVNYLQFPTKSYTHNTQSLTAQNLSTIVHEDLGAWYSAEDIQAKVVQIFSESWHVIEEKEGGIAQELYLQPGTYHLEIECRAHAGFLLQRVTVQLQPSKKYVAYCIGDFEDGVLGEKVAKRALAAVSEESNFESDKTRLIERVQSGD